jgi:hypothetical protein
VPPPSSQGPQGPQGPPPRASASVRPGGPFGPPESLSDDFGASNGYAAQASDGYAAQASDGYAAPAPGVYGPPAAPAGGNTYGAPSTYGAAASDDYAFDSDEYNGYGAPSYAPDQGDYGYSADSGDYADNGYGPEAEGYDLEGGRETGDPAYKGRRHRPSANDTNVGSLSDFAAYGGYAAEPPDDRYVQGYAPPRGRH